MKHSGSCRCKQWTLLVSTEAALSNLNPRVCDCDYCKAHPSAIISAPDMLIELSGNSANLSVDKNGDELAAFYRCKSCTQFLAVGCEIDGQLRGAVNASLLDEKSSLGPAIPIQPRLLSAAEKLARWSKLWGKLKGV